MARQRIGARNHTADFQRHDGTLDGTGMPTLWNDPDWDVTLRGWPCERITASGGEIIRGRQVTAQATHVFFGEWAGVRSVQPTWRLVEGGNVYDLTAVLDQDGDHREMRIEAKRET